MDTGVLFDHLDRVERRESPLTPIHQWLSSDHRYVVTEETCPDPDCDGSLWEGPGDKICGTCSIVKDGSRSIDNQPNLWDRFQDDRPRYRNSNRQRQVGGFGHEWVESEDVDGSIDLVDPVDFYETG